MPKDKNKSYLVLLEKRWGLPTLACHKDTLPSALESLTSEFGMGSGVTSLL